MTHLVLVGGGHAHVEVLRSFGERPLAGARLTLVSPTRFTPYSGMLPGLVAGHYDFRTTHIDLEPLARFAQAQFLAQHVVALDPAARRVALSDGSVLAYDLASIDIGSTPATMPGAREHAIPVKPVEAFLERLEDLVDQGRADRLENVAVIGGGAAGVEVLLAVQHRLRRAAAGAIPRFALLTDTPAILPNHNARVRRIFERILAERGVATHAGSPVVSIDADGPVIASGAIVRADAVIIATGASPQSWPRDAGLAVDARGFIRVRATLESVSHPGVFAAGDIASMDGRPRPKSGVYAVRQGPPIARNLRAALNGQPLAPYVPQSDALALISTGDKYAVASRDGWALEGAWVWRWKDCIDRRFMRTYAGPFGR